MGKSKKNQGLNESMQTETDKKIKKTKKKKNLVHQLNVEVKSNQEAFRNYYYEEIKPFLEKISLDG